VEICKKRSHTDARPLNTEGGTCMEGQRKIIAIIGLSGAGKTEVVEYIIERYGWPKVYFGEVTFDEMARRGLAISEENERAVREGLRSEFGPLVYAERVIQKIEPIIDTPHVLVESLYSWEEFMRFRDVFGSAFLVVAVHASPAIRYARLAIRPKRPLTAAEAWSRDRSQIENLHQAGPIAMADFLIINEGEREDLLRKVDALVRNL